MKTIAERAAAVTGRWLILSSLFVSACAGDGVKSFDPADPTPPKQVLTKRIDDELQARAVDYGNEHTRVALRDRKGRAVFTVDATPSDDDHLLLTSTMSLAQSEDSEAGTISEQIEIERGEGASLPLEDQVISALIMHGQYEQAEFGNYATQDSEGCTITRSGKGYLVNRASCSRKGGCCEQHDQCYIKYHCTSDSWSAGKGSAACKACNEQVWQCVFSKADPGPAPCCATKTCGTDRGATWMDGDPIAPFPSPATKSGLDPSLSIPGSPVRRTVDTTSDGGLPETSEPASDDVATEGAEPGDDAGYTGDDEATGEGAPGEPDQDLELPEPDGAGAGDDELDNAEPADEEPDFTDPDDEQRGDDEESDFADPGYEEPGYEEPDYEEPDYEESDYEDYSE